LTGFQSGAGKRFWNDFTIGKQCAEHKQEGMRRMGMSIPDLSPLVAANLVCHSCGTVLKPKVVMGRRGQKQVVDHLEYVCKNKETGCNYKVHSTVMTDSSSQIVALRDDGSEVRIAE
jgi:RNase P subunit RPR2